MRWGRPSLEGRRLALDRKFSANVAAYRGRVKLVTLTPPGEDLLPFGDETRKIQGVDELQVDWAYRYQWNWSAQRRASRLFEAAQRAADRFVRRQWGGQLPRQLCNVRAEQKRGVWHFHYLLPYETKIEQVWSRTVERYMNNAWRQDQARWPDEAERRRFIEHECLTGEIQKGFYGFGFVHGGKQQGRSTKAATGYMSRNAAGYMAGNSAGVGYHYVSSRLTRETGVTMRALRSVNWLYVRRRMVKAGELTEVIPSYWTPEWTARVLEVEALVTSGGSP
jgi:hypothetical protein